MTVEMLEAMAANSKVLHYLDLPIQHAADSMLKKMNRKAGIDKIRQLLDQARQIMPDIIFRTTFIVGLPGESREDFGELVSFVKEQRFANVGVFAYSAEEGTPAFTMEPKVPSEIAQARLDELMTAQQKIAEEIWRGFVGRTIDVLIEETLHTEQPQDFTHVGRFYGQAPDIDGLTYCRLSSRAVEGSILKLRVIDSSSYDLFTEE
jgi:ribosomal protein S12 methylthiotransferase